MSEPLDEAAVLLARALDHARKAPLTEVFALLGQAERLYRDAGQAAEAAGVLVEEARLRARSFEAAEIRRAHGALDRAERLLRDDPRPEVRARLAHVRGYAHLRGGNPGAALQVLREAESAFHELADARGEAQVLDTLGVLWERRGDREMAALLLARSHVLKSQVGDLQGVAIALGNLGRLALHGGKPREAEEFFQLDLTLAREQGDRRSEALVLTNLSECAVARGDLEAAAAKAKAALAIARQAADPVTEGFAQLAWSDVERAGGDYDAALEKIDRAETCFQPVAMNAGIAHARLRRGRALVAAGRDAEAARAAVGAARAARLAHVPDLAVEALLEAHRAFLQAKERRRAHRFLQRAQETAMAAGLEDLVRRVRATHLGQAASQAATETETFVTLEKAVGPFAGREGHPLRMRVEGLLGQGAFGLVLLVRDVEGGGLYALKRLHQSAERLRSLERRLRREFTSMARVDSEALVAHPFGFGHEDGQPCLLEELVESRGRHHSLEDLMDDVGALEPALVIRIARDIALGLAAIHAAGVVHRDIKPGNVLLCRTGRALLSDYGLAYDLNEDEYVPEGGFKGALGYSAPELCSVDQDAWATPTPASDLYSLGVVLYQALIGSWPFDHEESVLGILRSKLTGPPDLSGAEHVPEAVRTLLVSLLAPDPSARPSSAEAVVDVLSPLVAEGADRE